MSNKKPFLQRLVDFIVGPDEIDAVGHARSWLNAQTGYGLTGAQQQQNEFNSAEAAAARDWSAQMDNTKYQRTVADMKAAGVNPALAMSGGVSAPPSASSASSGSSNPVMSMSDLMSLMLAKKQGKLLDAQAANARAQGDAALQNANTNSRNADTAEGRLGVDKFDAQTRRMLANNEIRIGDSTLELNEAKVAEIAQTIKESQSRIELQDIEKLAKNLDYQFSMEMYDTNKELLIQQLAYRAVEMSNIQQMMAESRKRIELMTNEQAGTQWMADHPKLASGLGIASGITGVIGNVLKGSISAVAGRWVKN